MSKKAFERKHPFPINLWSIFTMLRFTLLGIKFGRGLRTLGPLLIRSNQGYPGNIRLGKNVTLFPYVDLRVRETGNIVLGDGVYLETMVRLVAANDAILKVGNGSQVGMGTIVNAGASISIGDMCAIAAYCNIISSEHAYFDPNREIKTQGYVHAPIMIGSDVWIASGVVVRPGVSIGDGVVVGTKSVVHGDIPSYTLAMGNPAKVVRSRA